MKIYLGQIFMVLAAAVPVHAGQGGGVVEKAQEDVRSARVAVDVMMRVDGLPENLTESWAVLSAALDALDVAIGKSVSGDPLGLDIAPANGGFTSGGGFVGELTLPDSDDELWRNGMARATRYGRPDRTSENDLDDGSHYEQSSDDRVYREQCHPGRVVGIDLALRSGTQALHWRWHTSTGDPGEGVREWRAFVNENPLGPVGDRIVRVADTDVVWYEYVPDRSEVRQDGRFALLVACSETGLQELEIHYHH